MADKGTVIKILLIECSLYTAGTHMLKFYIVILIEMTRGISSFKTYMQLQIQLKMFKYYKVRLQAPRRFHIAMILNNQYTE